MEALKLLFVVVAVVVALAKVRAVDKRYLEGSRYSHLYSLKHANKKMSHLPTTPGAVACWETKLLVELIAFTFALVPATFCCCCCC